MLGVKKHPLIDCFFLLLLLTGLFFLWLGVRPLFVPDEGRYAEIAREMAESHNYLTPYLNYIKYFEKPPLFYWLGALAIKLTHPQYQIWALRSINAGLGLLGCLVAYLTGRKLFNREVGFLTGILLATSTLYFAMAHMVNLDLTVTFFLSLCLYAFLLATREISAVNRKYLMWVSASACALAVLTKGLMGIVLPSLIVFVWLICTNNFRLLAKLFLPSSFLIFFAIALPWHVLVSIKNPEFFHFYFIEQHFLRYTTTDIGHVEPWWYFGPCLVIGFFPWIVFLPESLKFNLTTQRSKETFFLLLWASIIFVFFSLSKSKLISYILPVLPPIAMLTANFLQSRIQLRASITLKLTSILLILFSIAISIVFLHFAWTAPIPHPHHAKRLLSLSVAVLLLGNLVGLALSFRSTRLTVYTIAATSYLFLLTSLIAIPSIDTRTILPFAERIQPLLQSNDEVVTFGLYYQDLPFYLKRRVTVVGWLNELGFGVDNQNASAWMIDSTTFWGRWNSEKRLYVVMNNAAYNEIHQLYWNIPFWIMRQDRNNILVTNHPINLS